MQVRKPANEEKGAKQGPTEQVCIYCFLYKFNNH